MPDPVRPPTLLADRLPGFAREWHLFCADNGIEEPVVTINPDVFNEKIVFSRREDGRSEMMLPMFFLAFNKKEQRKKVFEYLCDHHVKQHSQPITRLSHPQLREAYELWCLSHHIEPMPPLYASSSPFLSAEADFRNGRITLGPQSMREPLDAQLADIGHEMGHLLERGPLPRREQERHADLTCVMLTGRHEPFSESLKRGNAHRDRVLPELLKSKNREDRRQGRRWVNQLKQGNLDYGTDEERLAEIKAFDPDDITSTVAEIDDWRALHAKQAALAAKKKRDRS